MPYHIEDQKKVAIISNNIACDRNRHYVSQIEKYMKLNNWNVEESFEDVDKIIISACGFHHEMYKKIKNALKIINENKFSFADVILMGCLTRTHKSQLESEFNGQIIEFGKEEEINDIIKAKTSFHDVGEINIFTTRLDDLRLKEDWFYINIAKGCLCKCTYCVIKKAKGYIKSVPVKNILQQYKTAMDLGFRKIFLGGEDVFGYGIDIGSNIMNLLEDMLLINDKVKFEFSYTNCVWLDKYGEGLLKLCKKGVFDQLNIPIQHVNDHVLTKMGRSANIKNTYKVIQSIKKECPEILISTEIIVGFPGETDKDFQELLDFFKQDECFDGVTPIGYSDLKGTISYKYNDKVDPHIISMRFERMNKILEDRSPYNQNPNIIYKLDAGNDFVFCKNSYIEKS
ncbi:MAG: radical SAM protein [Candidatus Odinarchaeota archaeon]